MKFKANVHLSGKTSTGIQVPAEVVEALGAGKRPPVQVSIGGHTYRTTVAVMGGEYWIPLSAENRVSAGATAGDEVEVDIALDQEPREMILPPDFAEALEHDADAKKFFGGLSYSNKRRFVFSIEDAKTEETRRRRIEKAVGTLKDGKIS